MKAGDSKVLAATVTPDYAADKTIIWSSSDEAVAKADKDGTVNAMAKGMTTITVTTQTAAKPIPVLSPSGKTFRRLNWIMKRPRFTTKSAS